MLDLCQSESRFLLQVSADSLSKSPQDSCDFLIATQYFLQTVAEMAFTSLFLLQKLREKGRILRIRNGSFQNSKLKLLDFIFTNLYERSQ
jgi:hypothetical protein